MTDTIDVGAAIDRVAEAALRIKAERDELKDELTACRKALRHNSTEAFKHMQGLRKANDKLRAEVAMLKAAAAAVQSGSLLRKPSAQAPKGCYCFKHCGAPVVQGVQQPCRDPEKAASFARRDAEAKWREGLDPSIGIDV